jgi:hypothetical protein
MVPVAGQDAVLNAAPIEWKTHMRAAIVEREHVPALMHHEDRAMAAVHNESPFGLYLFQGARAHEVRGLSIHGKLIRQAVRGNAIQQGPFPICQSRLRCTSSADQS